MIAIFLISSDVHMKYITSASLVSYEYHQQFHFSFSRYSCWKPTLFPICIAHLSIVQMKSILDNFFHDSCLLSISNRKSFIHHLFHCQYFQSIERQHYLHGQNMRIEKIQYSFLLVCLVLVISHSFDLDFEMKSNRHDASSRGIFKRAKGAKSSMKKTKASSKEPKSSSRRLKHFKTTKAPTITSTKQPTNESPTKSSKTPKTRRLTKVI